MDLSKLLDISNCIPSVEVNVRFSSTSNRLYAEAAQPGGCITLSQISDTFKDSKTVSPLYSLETGIWNLDSDLYIEDGVTLVLVGTKDEGDVDELRLLSNSETFVNLRAHGGNILMDGIKVFSWDDSIQGPDENQNDGRAYISCLSEKLTGETCEGAAKNDMGECRMDVLNSEIGYLGYHASESWGLSWKVRGFCKDKSNFDVFDSVKLYGDITNSVIHHNYYGHYSFGLLGGNWIGNEIHSNTVYALDPHDLSRDLTISDNLVYDNGNHGIIASKWCSNVTITNNVVKTSNVGIFLHSLGDDSVVKDNEVSDCDSGIAYLESSRGVITGNTLVNNRIGIRFSVGSTQNLVKDNLIMGSKELDVSTYEGNEKTVEASSGRPSDILFVSNYFSGEISITESDGIVFEDNEFTEDVKIAIRDSSVLVDDETVVVTTTGESCLGNKVQGNKCGVSEVSSVPTIPASVVLTFSPTASPTASPTDFISTSTPTASPTVATVAPLPDSRDLTSGSVGNSNGFGLGLIFSSIFVVVSIIV